MLINEWHARIWTKTGNTFTFFFASRVETSVRSLTLKWSRSRCVSPTVLPVFEWKFRVARYCVFPEHPSRTDWASIILSRVTWPAHVPMKLLRASYVTPHGWRGLRSAWQHRLIEIHLEKSDWFFPCQNDTGCLLGGITMSRKFIYY